MTVAAYQRTQLTIASPDQQVLLLFRAVDRMARGAEEDITQEDLPAAHQHLVDAQELLSLLSTLVNPSAPAPIRENLAALLHWMVDSLVQANIDKSRERIAEVLSVLAVLVQTWERLLGPAAAPATQR